MACVFRSDECACLGSRQKRVSLYNVRACCDVSHHMLLGTVVVLKFDNDLWSYLSGACIENYFEYHDVMQTGSVFGCH